MVIINTGLLHSQEIESSVRIALDEDIGTGDLTARLVRDEEITATLICRETAILSGRPWFDSCFHVLDESIVIDWQFNDGDQMQANDVVCRISGSSRTLLTAERTALNFLQTLSAVATTTGAYVDAVAGTGSIILDTRKTLPGLRMAEKYAVSCGGGKNHRIGLFDAVLIKENHIHAAGSICKVLELAEKHNDGNVMIEIEVEDIEQLIQAIQCGATRVLLDNFSLDSLKQAVKIAGDRVETEASGNISLQNVKSIAKSGVNFISIGALTKNIKATDFSLLFTQ